MSRHLRERHGILLALGAGLLGLLGIAAYVARNVGVATQEALPLTGCPVAIAYVSKFEIRTFNAGHTTSAALRVPPGWRVQRLLGQVMGRGGWVSVIAKNGVTRVERRIVLFTREKVKVLVIAQASDEAWDVLRASLWKDRVVVPSVEGGQLSIAVYDICGRRLMRKELRLPGIRLRDEVNQVQMSDAGLAVSSVRAVDREDRQVYLFGKTGRPTRCLGEGTSPVITRDGRRVAFVKWYSRDSDRYTVVLHDVRRNRTRTVEAWRPLRFRDAYPFLGGKYADSVRIVRWSPNGRWLVCGLSRGFSVTGLMLTAIDTRSPEPRRCYLPMVVEGGQWVTDGDVSNAE